jgi:hypothetical protein
MKKLFTVNEIIEIVKKETRSLKSVEFDDSIVYDIEQGLFDDEESILFKIYVVDENENQKVIKRLTGKFPTIDGIEVIDYIEPEFEIDDFEPFYVIGFCVDKENLIFPEEIKEINEEELIEYFNNKFIELNIDPISIKDRTDIVEECISKFISKDDPDYIEKSDDVYNLFYDWWYDLTEDIED